MRKSVKTDKPLELVSRELEPAVAVKNNNMMIGDNLEILKMQEKIGNRLTAAILEQKADDELIKNLTVSAKEEVKEKGKAMRQLMPCHGNVDNKELPEKILELVFPAGIVHLGYDKREKQVVLVTEESSVDKRKVPLYNSQKVVYKNRPHMKRDGSQFYIAQDWTRGSVAIIDSIDKKMGRILSTFKKMVEREREGKREIGNIKYVLPFLDQNKEVVEIRRLQEIKAQLKISLNRGTEDRGITSRKKAEVDKLISKKNTIAEKKKSREEEFIKKLRIGFKIDKSSSQKTGSNERLLILQQKRRRRRKEEEEKGIGLGAWWLSQEKEQKDKRKKEQEKRQERKQEEKGKKGQQKKDKEEKERRHQEEKSRSRWGYLAGSWPGVKRKEEEEEKKKEQKKQKNKQEQEINKNKKK